MNTTFIATSCKIEVAELLRYLRTLDFRFYNADPMFSIRNAKIPKELQPEDLNENLCGNACFKLEEIGGVRIISLYQYQDSMYPDREVRQGRLPQKMFKDWDYEMDRLSKKCEESDQEFYDSFLSFVRDTAIRLTELDPYYGHSLLDDHVVVNGTHYESEMTISPYWPDEICRRVLIDGKYYYFS